MRLLLSLAGASQRRFFFADFPVPAVGCVFFAGPRRPVSELVEPLVFARPCFPRSRRCPDREFPPDRLFPAARSTAGRVVFEPGDKLRLAFFFPDQDSFRREPIFQGLDCSWDILEIR